MSRILVEAIPELPGGLVAVPVGPEHVEGITDLMRAADLADSGHSEANAEDVRAELDDPGCAWGAGAAVVLDAGRVVAVAFTMDGLGDARGWTIDAFSAPGDPRSPALLGALVDAGFELGRARWVGLPGHARLPAPVVKSGCQAGDALTRSVLEARGLAEVRRFWRMRIAHGPDGGASGLPEAGPGGESGLGPGASGASGARSGSGTGAATSAPRPSAWVQADPPAPQGYRIRPVQSSEAELRTLHATANAAFAGHFDFSALDFDDWLTRVTLDIEDPSQWLIAERDGQPAAFVRGSNRFASEGSGYVVSLGTLPEHRGNGLARALLEARFADDRWRGFGATMLDVDAANPTGATRLYESVGMTVHEELVWFHGPLLAEG